MVILRRRTDITYSCQYSNSNISLEEASKQLSATRIAKLHTVPHTAAQRRKGTTMPAPARYRAVTLQNRGLAVAQGRHCEGISHRTALRTQIDFKPTGMPAHTISPCTPNAHISFWPRSVHEATRVKHLPHSCRPS